MIIYHKSSNFQILSFLVDFHLCSVKPLGYADAEKVQLMVANQAVEDYCFSKILMYIPDLKTDTDRLSDAIELLRNHRYRILNNQSLEASKSMGINWIAGLKCALL